MKYKCIQDYWMDNESTDKGYTPAFVGGDVYEFIADNLFENVEVLHTLSNNHGMQHTMEKQELDNSGHFELVEE